MNLKREQTQYLRFVSLLVAAVLGTFVTSSCTDQRKIALETRLNKITAESDQLRQSIAKEEGVLQAFNQRLSAQRAALGEYNASVQGYILDHKMAVAAIGAGMAGVSTLDPKNRYSEDVKDVGLGTALLAALWAVNNVDEVSEVIKTLNQADAHLRSLEAEIAQTLSAIQRQQSSIQQDQEQLRSFVQEQAAVGQEIKGT